MRLKPRRYKIREKVHDARPRRTVGRYLGYRTLCGLNIREAGAGADERLGSNEPVTCQTCIEVESKRRT